MAYRGHPLAVRGKAHKLNVSEDLFFVIGPRNNILVGNFHLQGGINLVPKFNERNKEKNIAHLGDSLVCFEIVKLNGPWKTPSQNGVAIPRLDYQVLAQGLGEDVVLTCDCEVCETKASEVSK